MGHPDRRTRLIQLLKELAYERRRVVLASGRESDFYVDARQVTLHPEGADDIGYLIWQLLKAPRGTPELGPVPTAASRVWDDLDREQRIPAGIGGLESGAIPIATAVSLTARVWGAHIPAFIVRKQVKAHGTQVAIEGAKNIPEGSEVVIVEDTATTGGSTLKAIRAALAQGWVVSRVITLVDRQEGAAENLAQHGFLLEALVTRADLEGA